MKQFLLATLFSFTFLAVSAQIVSDFEGLLSEPETFRDATEGSTQFSNAGAEFHTGLFPGTNFWTEGWAISNITDSITSGFGNLHAAKTASGFQSETYAVGQQSAVIRILPDLRDRLLDGVYITNNTYAHNSMRDGDYYAKKFGGDFGDDPDFFKLNILGYKNGLVAEDTVEFFLADYRFEDNSQDYIIDTWEWVDLSVLGAVDSLMFILESTDVGGYGINTPTFFCIDNFTISETVNVFEPTQQLTDLKAYPNPTTDVINLDLQSFENQEIIVDVFHLNGQLISSQNTLGGNMITVDLSALKTGSYIVKVASEDKVGVQRITKF